MRMPGMRAGIWLLIALIALTGLGPGGCATTDDDESLAAVPTGLSAAAGDGQVTLSWTAVDGATSYNLYWSTTAGVSKSTGTQIAGASSPYAHTGLSNGTTYYYVVTAVNAAGESAESAEVGVTPQVSAPAAPTGVSATAGNGQVTLSWTAVSGATSYNLYFSTSTGVTKTTGTKIAGVTSPYTHTGRTNGTTYYYVVTAVSAGGESAESAQVSATPQAPVTSHNLVVDGDNTFGSIHPGSTVYLRVVNTATNAVAGTGTYTQVITSSGFTFSLTGILTAGASYRVDFFVDLGTAGVCVTGVDHYWRYTTGVVSANVTIVTIFSSHNDQQTDVCATFSP